MERATMHTIGQKTDFCDKENLSAEENHVFPKTVRLATACKDKQNSTRRKSLDTHTPRKTPRKSAAKKHVLSSTKNSLHNCLSSKRSSKKARLTPPRDLASRKRISQNLNSPFSSAAPRATPVKSLTPLGEYVLRSSETEPSDYQLSLPSQEEVLLNAKLCHLIDTYTYHNREFDFASLAGLSRSVLEKQCSGESKPILSSLLDAADDMVIEGFYREYFGEQNDKRVEACIFSSSKLRRIFVCYRSSTSLQAKPIPNRKMCKLSDMDQGCTMLHADHQVAILPLFRDAYFTKQVEENIFSLIDSLSVKYPFYDMIFTGHSFGAALSTIAATRYAALHPMIRVSCFGFGSPRIGGMDFRQLVHSFPNLKVIRLELASDPYTSMPEGSQWHHVGHTIVIDEHQQQTTPLLPNIGLSSAGVVISAGGGSSTKTSVCSNKKNDENSSAASSSNIEVVAYRFDKERPGETKMLRNGMKALSKLAQPHQLLLKNQNHEMESYMSILKEVESSNSLWVNSFAGMSGPGVSGIGNEDRKIV